MLNHIIEKLNQSIPKAKLFIFDNDKQMNDLALIFKS